MHSLRSSQRVFIWHTLFLHTQNSKWQKPRPDLIQEEDIVWLPERREAKINPSVMDVLHPEMRRKSDAEMVSPRGKTYRWRQATTASPSRVVEDDAHYMEGYDYHGIGMSAIEEADPSIAQSANGKQFRRQKEIFDVVPSVEQRVSMVKEILRNEAR